MATTSRPQRPGPSASGFPPARTSRAEELARHLEQQIVDGGLQGGERLGTKEDLRRQYGLAVATINEAVRLLENRGLITARSGPGGGVFVAEPSTRARLNHLVLGFKTLDRPFTDCLRVRNQLEPLLCQEAFDHCRAPDAKKLRAIVTEMEKHTDQPAEFLRLNWSLHRYLTRMCANAALRTIYLTLMDFVEEGLRDVSADEFFDGEENLEIHRELVEAIIGIDQGRLHRAVERHTPVAARWVSAAG